MPLFFLKDHHRSRQDQIMARQREAGETLPSTRQALHPQTQTDTNCSKDPFALKAQNPRWRSVARSWRAGAHPTDFDGFPISVEMLSEQTPSFHVIGNPKAVFALLATPTWIAGRAGVTIALSARTWWTVRNVFLPTDPRYRRFIESGGPSTHMRIQAFRHPRGKASTYSLVHDLCCRGRGVVRHDASSATNISSPQ